MSVASPREHLWTLQIAQDSQVIVEQQFAVRPDEPFERQVTWGKSTPLLGNSDAATTVRIMDAEGNLVLENTI